MGRGESTLRASAHMRAFTGLQRRGAGDYRVTCRLMDLPDRLPLVLMRLDRGAACRLCEQQRRPRNPRQSARRVHRRDVLERPNLCCRRRRAEAARGRRRRRSPRRIPMRSRPPSTPPRRPARSITTANIKLWEERGIGLAYGDDDRGREGRVRHDARARSEARAELPALAESDVRVRGGPQGRRAGARTRCQVERGQKVGDPVPIDIEVSRIRSGSSIARPCSCARAARRAGTRRISRWPRIKTIILPAIAADQAGVARALSARVRRAR